MSDPERQPNADKTPNEVGAEESERRRESEQAGQRHANEQARAEPDPYGRTDSGLREATTGGGGSNADQAKKNEHEAEEEGRELPG